MKAYRVNVNGNTYEITLEVIDKSEIMCYYLGVNKNHSQIPAREGANGNNQQAFLET